MNKEVATKEIDVIGLIRKVAKEWKTLLLFVSIAAVIGLIVAFTMPKEYTSKVVLAPEVTSMGGSMLGGLGDLVQSFGYDIGNSTSVDAIYPDIYPNIFSSTDFVMGLLDAPLQLSTGGTKISYQSHLMETASPGLIERLRLWVSSFSQKKKETSALQDSPFFIPKQKYALCNAIRKKILCTVDKKTSLITISVTDRDPLAAAILADTLQSRLQKYIMEYRTKKARIDYDYYVKLLKESKRKYERSRRQYASFVDSNQGVFLQSYRQKQEELENEMQLQYNIYSKLVMQVQSAQAKIQERLPAFTILETPKMPIEASSTPRSFVLLLFLFLGVVLDGIWVCIVKNLVCK